MDLFSYQPIIHLNTGECYGVYCIPNEYFMKDYETIILKEYSIDLQRVSMVKSYFNALRKVVDEFGISRFRESTMLFYRLDIRIFYDIEVVETIIKRDVIQCDLPTALIVLCISYADVPVEYLLNYTEICRRFGFKTAISDCMIHVYNNYGYNYIKPDFVFILERTADTQINLEKFRKICKNNSIALIATDVNEIQELDSIINNLYCHLICGDIIYRKTNSIAKLQHILNSSITLELKGGYAKKDDGKQLKRSINENIEHMPPIILTDTTSMLDILKYFQHHRRHSFCIILNSYIHPLGIIREPDLRSYIFSKHGFALLSNPTYTLELPKYISKQPVAEIDAEAETMLDIYINNNNSEGIIITMKGIYVGFLHSNALIKILYEYSIRQEKQKSIYYRTLIDSLFDGLVIANQDYIVDYNKELLNLFGCNDKDILNKSITKLLNENIINNIGNNHNDDSCRMETSAYKKDGMSFPVEVQCKHIEIDDDNFTFIAVKDITRRRKAEQEIREYQTNLENMVLDETNKRLQQQEMLIQQSKMAQMLAPEQTDHSFRSMPTSDSGVSRPVL